MTESTLRRLQLTQLEILRVFDRICVEHGLKYSLYAGSLLGAVRHGGFIPWDDDLDVCMSRADYDRFIALWDSVKPEGYLLQNKENTPAFTQSFTKIRKDHTTFLQYESEKGKYHTGIFLDIFPVDRIPNGRFDRLLFKWNCMKYQLFTREFVPPKGNMLLKAGCKLILACTPERKRQSARQKALSRITQYQNQTELETVMIETMGSVRKAYAADLLDAYTALPFEDGEYMCFAGWDDHLKRKFGDYMQLPPAEERGWRHHPIILDFERNYEEIN